MEQTEVEGEYGATVVRRDRVSQFDIAAPQRWHQELCDPGEKADGVDRLSQHTWCNDAAEARPAAAAAASAGDIACGGTGESGWDNTA